MPFYFLGLLSVFLFFVISFLALCFSYILLRLSQKSKAVFYFSTVIFITVSILGAISTFLELFNFLKLVTLENMNSFLIAAALVFIITVFCLCNRRAIYKYCLFVAVICAAIILICFLSGIKNYDISAIALSTKFNLLAILKCTLPIMVLPKFLVKVWRKK